MVDLSMKALILFLTVTMAAAGSLVAQSLQLRHHGDLDRVWSLPVTPDGSTGIEGYPGSGVPFINQMAARFTSTGGTFEAVNLYIDDITAGTREEEIGYAGEQASFAWPLPFNHVPQTFLKHATRFTAPEDARLRDISIFAGSGSTSSDGFNDSLRVSFYGSFQPESQTVKYGNENPENNPNWEFNFPVGTARDAYGTRFTLPAGVLLSGTEFWVQNMNHNTFLPEGDPVPNDTLWVRVWNITEGVPDTTDGDIGSVKVALTDITVKEWNAVSLQSLNIITETETDLAITFELIAVDLQDHMAFSTGAATTPVIGRSLLRENGSWNTIATSDAYGDGAAANVELWIRAQYVPTAQIVDEPGTPDTSAPLGEPVTVVLSDLQLNAWNTLPLPDRGLDVRAGQDVWVVTELLSEGSPDALSLISDSAEPTPRSRSAVYVSDSQGGERWLFMQNSQFNNEYILRKRATFVVEDNTQITDNLFVVLYDDDDGLPGTFLDLVELPLTSVVQGEFNRIDVSAWGSLREVFHIGVTGTFTANPFSLGTDDGSAHSNPDHTTSVYVTVDETWMPADSLDGVSAVNMLLNVDYLQGTSLASDAQLPGQIVLHEGFPNPFNPATTVAFELPETMQIRLTAYDVLGRPAGTLSEGMLPAGRHEVRFDASSLSSGTYLLRLEAGSQVRTRAVTLVK